jgi:hypothetical protein
MNAQSLRSPNRDSFGTPLWESHFESPGEKCHSDASTMERHREYYMGEGGGFPQVRAVVSQVSPRLPVACPNTKSVQNEF